MQCYRESGLAENDTRAPTNDLRRHNSLQRRWVRLDVSDFDVPRRRLDTFPAQASGNLVLIEV
jgi:hypothetical protein